MLLNDFIKIMEEIAPPDLKEDFDNVGLMVGDRKSEIKKILIALDCTSEVINEAKEKEVDLILTHHPLIFKKPSSITTDTLLGNKIIELIRSNINLYSAHTNWDSVKEGINDTIVKMLGMNSELIMDKCADDAGIGRIVSLEKEMTLEELIDRTKKVLRAPCLRYVGNLENKILKIAVINGSGQSYIEQAKNLGANLIITGDTTYHYASDYEEMGMSIIDVGHFKSEWPVLIEVSNKVKEKVLNIDHEVEFIISKKSKDPYSFK